MPDFCPHLTPDLSEVTPGPVGGWELCLKKKNKTLLPSSYLVMPFMQTDLQKIMGMEFSEDKVQYLVYQMLKGLKVGRARLAAKGDFGVESQPTVTGQRRVLGAGGCGSWCPQFTTLFPFQYIHSAGIVHRVSAFPAMVPGGNVWWDRNGEGS